VAAVVFARRNFVDRHSHSWHKEMTGSKALGAYFPLLPLRPVELAIEASVEVAQAVHAALLVRLPNTQNNHIVVVGVGEDQEEEEVEDK